MSEHGSGDEAIDIPSSSSLEEANSHIRKAYEIMKHEATRLLKEKEAFDSVAKKLEVVHFGESVKLNVGGKLFDTSLSTLNKDPGSMLHAMFSGRFDTKAREDGAYFIDRDGTHFRYILNFLRTNQLVLPDDKVVQKEVLVEAEFYQINGIMDILAPNPFSKSTILNRAQSKTLVSWLPEEDSKLGEVVLLYRASRDGWASSDFHSSCDNKGVTVTIVKSGSYIFGGYTDQPWESPSSGTYKDSAKAFLFSLVSSARMIGPAKMTLKSGENNTATYCHSDYGPTFGQGHDLSICSDPNNKNCSSSPNKSYVFPAECANPEEFLAGNQNFTVTEVEVFGYKTES